MNYICDQKDNSLNSQKAIKNKNMRRIFSEIAMGNDVTRAGIARRLGLTPSTVSVLVDEMISQRLILESSVLDMGAIGRKPVQISVNPAGMHIPVLSFRSDGLHYTMVDCTLNTIESAFVPYPGRKYPPEENDYRIIETGEIMDMVHRLLDGSSMHSDSASIPVLCITMPGTFDWEKGSFSSTVTNHRGSTEFLQEIRRMFNDIPLLVGKTVRMRGYAEYMANDGMDPDTLFIELTEGIGSSIFLNGKCFAGTTGLAGEIGHITVNPFGPKCLCGNRGCLEKYAGTNALLKRVRFTKGFDMSWDEICEAYKAQDDDIAAIISEAARYLLASISNMICALNVRKIILGGDAVKLGDGFIDEIIRLKQDLGYRNGLSKVDICFAQLEKECESTGIAKLYQNQFHRYVR